MKHKSNVFGYLVLLLGFLILLSSVQVAATGTTFTSTADFDGGTKSSSGGNFEVETVTDNPSIVANAFSLGSIGGDSFTVTDADADTFKWDLVAFSAPTINERQITGGALNIQVTKDAYADAGVSSHSSYSGTVDIRVKSHFVSATAAVHFPWLGVSNEQVADCQATGTIDGVWMRFSTRFLVQSWSCVDGVLALVGGGTAITATDDICMRIAGSSGSWTTYYSTSPTCSSWNVEANPTTTVSGNLFSTLSVGVNVALSANAKYQLDDYSVASGTINAGGFRTSGNWQSSAQTPTSELFRFLNVTYSSASASTFITAVSLISGSGSYRFVDNSDQISGTSHSYAVPDLDISGAWKVQVNLTGASSSSVIVESISIFSSPEIVPACGFEDAIPGFAGLVIIFLAVAIIGVAIFAVMERRDQLTPTAAVALIVGSVIVVMLAAALLSPFPCG